MTKMDSDDEQVHNLIQKLQQERADRKKTEEEACSILRQVKKRYDDIIREKDQLIEEYKEAAAADSARITDLELTNQRFLDEVRELRDKFKRSTDEIRKDGFTTPVKSPFRSTNLTRSVSPAVIPSSHAESLLRQIDHLKQSLQDAKQQIEAKDDEITRCKERHQFTREINLELRSKITELEKTLREAQKESKTQDIESAKLVREKEEELNKQKIELETKVSELERKVSKLTSENSQLRKKIEEQESIIKKQLSDLEGYRKKLDDYRRQKAADEEREKLKLLNELRDLRKELDKKTGELEKRAQDTLSLKKICDEVELQAETFDRLLTKKTDECKQLLIEKSNIEREKYLLSQKVDKLEAELSSARQEKDSRFESLNDKIALLESSLAEEKERVRSLTNDLEYERTEARENIDRVVSLEEELNRAIAEANAADIRIQELESENIAIKEEAARHISEFMAQRSENSNLAYCLDEAKRRVELLEATIDSLHKTMDEEKQTYETEIYKLSERLRQHFDLESEMMNKIDKLEKAKKVRFNLP